MKPIYIVDGYNMIHQIPVLKDKLDRSLLEARTGLENIISGYVAGKAVTVYLVYDGQADVSDIPGQSNSHLKIIYSRGSLKADPLIKSLAKKFSRSAQLWVVTRDNDIIRYAKGYRVSSMPPAEFYRLILRPDPADEVLPKYDYDMPVDELLEWMDLFDKDAGKDDEDEFLC
ncbi:NYN domain-containing protein [bacterium]|nr:NYN domain-containing protein [bacterium]